MAYLRSLLTALLFTTSALAQAECTAVPAEFLPAAHEQFYEKRTKLFLSLCEATSGQMVDRDDIRLRDRLTTVALSPPKKQPSLASAYPPSAVINSVQGTVFVLVVTDKDGKITKISIVQWS
ncbi:MAG: hypothetical protein ABIQ86_12940 [Steroidobacteraceae bacterium]